MWIQSWSVFNWFLLFPHPLKLGNKRGWFSEKSSIPDSIISKTNHYGRALRWSYFPSLYGELYSCPTSLVCACRSVLFTYPYARVAMRGPCRLIKDPTGEHLDQIDMLLRTLVTAVLCIRRTDVTTSRSSFSIFVYNEVMLSVGLITVIRQIFPSSNGKWENKSS